MPEFNPFGQMLESRIASDKYAEQKEQNAFQRQMQERQMASTEQGDAMKRLKFVAPIVSNFSKLDPEKQALVWPGLTAEVNKVWAGTVPDIPWGPEAQQMVASVTSMQQAMNPPEYTTEGGQYIPKQPGSGGAIPIPGYQTTPEYTIKDGQYVPKLPGGGPAQPVPGFESKDKTPSFDFKNHGIGVINQLAGKIGDGTATEEEKTAYKLAEQAFTVPRISVDPVTGQQTMVSQSLPEGMPTFRDKDVKLPKGGASASIGKINFKPINDITKVTKAEAQKYRNTAKNVGLMKQELTDILDDVSQNGVRTVDPQVIMQRSSKYYNALMLYKEILNLGVLNGPDLDIMEKILVNPASMKGFAGGEGAVKSSFGNVIKTLDRNLSYIKGRGIDVGTEQPGAAPPPPTGDLAPMEGAKQAPDGNWYIQKGEQFFRVEQ